MGILTWIFGTLGIFLLMLIIFTFIGLVHWFLQKKKVKKKITPELINQIQLAKSNNKEVNNVRESRRTQGRTTDEGRTTGDASQIPDAPTTGRTSEDDGVPQVRGELPVFEIVQDGNVNSIDREADGSIEQSERNIEEDWPEFE